MGISRKLLRRLLCAVLLVALPVPFYLGALEVSPALRLFFLSGLTLAVVATEGAAGYLGAFAWLAVAQSLLWALAIWGLAALAARALELVPAAGLRLALAAALALGLLGLGSLDVYRTGLSSRGPQSSLAGLFD